MPQHDAKLQMSTQRAESQQSHHFLTAADGRLQQLTGCAVGGQPWTCECDPESHNQTAYRGDIGYMTREVQDNPGCWRQHTVLIRSWSNNESGQSMMVPSVSQYSAAVSAVDTS